MRGDLSGIPGRYSKKVSSCEYGGAQQQRMRNSLVPLFSRVCHAPGGMRTASPGRIWLVSPSITILPCPLRDEVDLLGDAVVVPLGRLLHLEGRLRKALNLRVVELADRRAVLRHERLDSVDRRQLH